MSLQFRALMVIGGVASAASSSLATAAPAGNALHFDGSDTVMIPDSDDFDGHTSLTVEMWIRADVLDLGSYLFDQVGPSPAQTGEWLVMLNAQSYGHPALTGYFRWPAIDQACASQHINVTDGKWHHLAVARDGPEIYFCIDGDLDVAGRFGGSLSMGSAWPIHLGSRGGFESFLHGEMDEVRFWDYARTPTEIHSTFNRIIDPNTPGLIGYWNFDEPLNDQSVLDRSPNGHHGTLGGSSSVGPDDPTRVPSTAPIIGFPGECNGNAIDDAVDIAAGTSLDCNLNSVPDECDLAGGPSVDLNTNGLPDECDVPGDLDNDGDVDFWDFTVLLAAFGTSVGAPAYNPAIDFNGDGTVGILDYQFWLQAYRTFVANPEAPPPAGMYGDADFDLDVDLADFMALQVCLNGPPGMALLCTVVFDSDGNTQLNTHDFTAFAQAYTGP